MVKKMKLTKDELRQINSGFVQEVDYSQYSDAHYNFGKVYEVLDNSNNNLIKIFFDKNDAEMFDAHYQHGNTPNRRRSEVFLEFLDENNIRACSHKQ